MKNGVHGENQSGTDFVLCLLGQVHGHILASQLVKFTRPPDPCDVTVEHTDPRVIGHQNKRINVESLHPLREFKSNDVRILLFQTVRTEVFKRYGVSAERSRPVVVSRLGIVAGTAGRDISSVRSNDADLDTLNSVLIVRHISQDEIVVHGNW